jgi:ATP-binding cassette subfamily B protein
MARTAPYKGKREKVEHPIKLFGRMMGLIFKKHIILTAFLVVFMLISAVSGTLASYLIKDLINTASDMNKVSSTDYSHFYLVLEEMAGLYVIGIAFTFAFQLILVRLTQKTLDKTRTNLFEHMENLPISYFDGQTTGEVMSVYTNDTDTLRQMISQAIPQAIICVAQIIGNVAVMMVLSWQLTMISIASIFVMFFVIKVISGKSSKYFILQQGDLSKINGYIEEMTKGQKVVKVFKS